MEAKRDSEASLYNLLEILEDDYEGTQNPKEDYSSMISSLVNLKVVK
jgi:hypothetical protein